MKNHSITAKRTSGIAFDIEVDHFHLLTDGPAQVGGQNLGPRPKPLLLSALAGCSGIDVVTILQKMRVDFVAFSIEVNGELTEEMPNLYNRIHLRYILSGQNLPREKVEKAITLSLEKYCGVAETLRRAGADITHEITLLDA